MELSFRELMFYAQTRPGMYLGVTTTEQLQSYLIGYGECLRNAVTVNDETAKAFFSSDFRDFVIRRHGGEDMSTGGVGILVHKVGMTIHAILEEIACFFASTFPDPGGKQWRPKEWDEAMENTLKLNRTAKEGETQ